MVALVTIVGSAAHHRGDNDAAVPWLASCLGVGLLVSYKRPRHPMGWMLLGVSGFLLLSGIGATYSILDYSQHHGHLPFGGVAVLIEPSWAPAIALTVLCVLLYPDGKPPSARWRWPLRWLVCVGATWQVGAFVIAASTLLTSRIRLDSAGDLQQLNNPSGTWAWWGIAQTLFFLTVAALTLAWVIGQVVGYPRLTGDRRIQQKWLLAGASVCVLTKPRAGNSARDLVASRPPSGRAQRPFHFRPRGASDRDRSGHPQVPAVRDRPDHLADGVVFDRDCGCWRGRSLAWWSSRPTCSRSRPRSAWRHRRSLRPRCSTHCASGFNARSTAASTGRATTPRRRWPRSPSGCAMRSISTPSAPICSRRCSARWNRPTRPSGSGRPHHSRRLQTPG